MPVVGINRFFGVPQGDVTQVPVRRRPATAGEAAGTDELTYYSRGFRVVTTAGNVAYLNWANEECFATSCQLYADTITQIRKIQASNSLGSTTAVGFEILE